MSIVKQLWVKKRVPGKDWKDWYSKIDNYCFLKREGSEVWIGFLAANEMPNGCVEMNEAELMLVDEYRCTHGIAPTPISEHPLKPFNQPEFEIDKEENRKVLDKMRADLSNKLGTENL